MFVRSRSPRSGVGGAFCACGRTGDGDSSANASSAKLTPVIREPGACDEATGVSGASQGGVAATRGVEARPDDDEVMELRAESRRSASASARSRIAVGSLFFGVVGVCGSARKKLKQWVSSVARAIFYNICGLCTNACAAVFAQCRRAQAGAAANCNKIAKRVF